MTDQKYECPVCGSKITNSATNISKHNKTIKHLKALETGVKPDLKYDDKAIKQRERMRLYRQQKKEQLGEEKYKEQERLAKQKYRSKPSEFPKVEQSEPVLFSMDQEEKMVQKAIKDQKQKDSVKQVNLIDKLSDDNLNDATMKVNKSTLETYMKNIGRLYKSIFDKSWDSNNFDWLKDHNNIIKFVNDKYKTDSTKLNYIKSIVSILQRLSGYDKLLQKYRKEQERLVSLTKKQAGTNKLSEREEKNWVEWTDLVKVSEFDNDQDLFIHSLYTAIPPRRNDYKYMKFFQLKKNKKKKAEDLDKNFNWLVFNSNGNPSKLVFNKYKTSKAYGQQVFDISGADKKPIFDFTKLRKASKAYVIANFIEDGDLLFPNNKNQVYDNFNPIVVDAFKQFLPKKVGVNILRHSFISHYNTKGKNLSVNSMKEISKWTAHSINEMLQYRKFSGSGDFIDVIGENACVSDDDME